MATPFNSRYHFCLFCYKTIESSVETPERAKAIQTFINQLNNHVKTTKPDSQIYPTVLLKKLSVVDNLLNCCNGCEDKLETFCEKYQQLKVLEMELDWKLGQLMEEINYANILPTRWIHVDNVLEETFQNDLERKCGSHNLIKKLRQFVVNAGNQQRKQSRPRVLLKRNKKLDDDASKMVKEAGVKEKALSEDDLQQLNKNWTCPKCEKRLKTAKGLEYHIETHKDPSEWKFECPHCGKKLPTERELKGHIRVHTGEKPYECTFCGMKYQIRSGLTYHLKNVHADEEGLEEELRKRFSIKSGSTLKESTTPSDDYIKTECIEDVDSTNFETEDQIIEDLLIQIKVEHSDTSDNIDDGPGLQPLENIDEDVYQNEKRKIEIKCTKCGKTFKRKFNLKMHLETHKNPNEWKYKCTKCNQKFPVQYSLKCHMETHEKRQHCPYCPIHFATMGNLRRHIKCKHSNHANRKIHPSAKRQDKETPLENIGQDGYQNETGNIEIKCPKCGKTFKRKSSLKNHLETHKNPNEWKYSCTKCNKKFPAQHYIIGHMETHEPKKRLQCPDCPTKFSMKNNLRFHMKFKCKHTNLANRRKMDMLSRKFHLSPKRKDDEIHRTEATIKEEQVESEKRQETHALTSGATNSTALDCEICGRKLTSLMLKERHFAKSHDLKGDSERKIVKCTELGCTAYFLKSCQLRFHRKLEHGEKSDQVESRKYTQRFGCPVCWKFYPNNTAFQIHMERHKDPSEWKFECKTCSRKFPQEHNLKLHMRTHTKEQKYECKFCVNKYKYVNSLVIHMKNVHRDQEEVKAQIAIRENKKVKTSDATKTLEVKDKCSLDVVECEVIEILDYDLVERDGIERDNVNEVAVIDEMVVEGQNIFGEDNDGSFVDLEDIY